MILSAVISKKIVSVCVCVLLKTEALMINLNNNSVSTLTIIGHRLRVLLAQVHFYQPVKNHF